MNTDNMELQHRISKGKKTMLLISMASMAMIFAGLTSAFVVSSKRADWLKHFDLPSDFYISTLLIVFSSLTIFLSKRLLTRNQHKKSFILLVLTFVLGVGFVNYQFKGFSEIIRQGYYFTGPQSNVTTSFIYAIVLTHLLHLFSGLLVLLVLIYNHYKQKYSTSKILGFELGSMYWHFLDIVWIYLILFFHFAG